MKYLFVLLTLAAVLLCPEPARSISPITGGQVRIQGASWWWGPGPWARVRVYGGEWGSQCDAEGGGCVVWAQGAWHRVEINGETVAARAWLPMVHSTTTTISAEQ